jgi:hypothetical protein
VLDFRYTSASHPPPTHRTGLGEPAAIHAKQVPVVVTNKEKADFFFSGYCNIDQQLHAQQRPYPGVLGSLLIFGTFKRRPCSYLVPGNEICDNTGDERHYRRDHYAPAKGI